MLLLGLVLIRGLGWKGQLSMPLLLQLIRRGPPLLLLLALLHQPTPL